MKKIFLILALFLVNSANAQEYPDKTIYEALNVEEEPVVSTAAQDIKEKSVGGFICRKVSNSISTDGNPAAYSCSFDDQRDSYDHRAIYEALDTDESPSRNRSSNAGPVYTKKVSHLTCTKSSNASGDFRFVCFM